MEESVHVVFDEIIHSDQSSTKVYVKEDEHNITLEKLESCPEKQPIDYVKQAGWIWSNYKEQGKACG